MAKLICGCGYLGMRVAQRWLEAGEQVFAVTRSPRRAEEFRERGLSPIVADVTDPSTLTDLPAASTLLYAVGFDRSAGKPMQEVYVEGLRNVLDALSPATQKIIYIGSTSVYAQTGGVWVDEDSPCHPQRDNGQVCLAAEETLQAHRQGSKAIQLRLAGLYGPGRIPRRAALMAGEIIPAPSEGYLNLIHVDDAARVVLAAEAQAPLPRLYLVSDGHPPSRAEYYAELARLVGGPPPKFAPPEPGSPAALRAESNKRIGNRRMLEELGVELEYPTYRQGLAAIVAGEA